RYVEAAQVAGLVREGGAGQLSDELIGVVLAAVRPVRADGHGRSWEALSAREEQIRGWVEQGLQLTNIEGKLTRLGVVVPYRTLHRFATERCGFGQGAVTVRVVDGQPGVECQIDFARMGFVFDPAAGRRRVAHALIFTAVYSRHMFVWLSFTQTLAAVIAGAEAAWGFFGGVFAVLVPDNMSPIIAAADPLNPTFTAGWLDYAQARGFGTDPARVRSPKDKPGVERAVQYVRGNFFAGESFVDLADAQARVQVWCATTAGLRVHGTTVQRPAELFVQAEQALLLAVPVGRYDVPVFATPKVARDLHVEVARALYSVPAELVGQRVDVRADSALVKVFSRGQLVKTHPRVGPGERSTDPEDYPVGRADYALRDVASLTAKAVGAGPAVGVYAARLLDSPLPWTRMRAVYRLLGLVRSYGPEPVNAACARALELDVVDVTKITRMLANATETDEPPTVAKVVGGPARFARDAAEFEVTR
ncbi:MAG: IS21 family transposase, partial [Actinomycetes bacterium]